MKGKKPLEVYYEVSAIQIFSTSEVSYPNVRELMKDASDSSSQSLMECFIRKLLISLCCWSEYYCFLNIIVGVISYYDDIYLSKLVTKVRVIPISNWDLF